MPQDERRKTVVLSAKVSKSVATTVRNAAIIRAWPTSRVVEEGALKRAMEILDEMSQASATMRRQARANTARKGGLARHGKRGE